MKKKILPLVLSIVVILQVFPLSVFAETSQKNQEAQFLADKGIMIGYNGDLLLDDYFTIEQLVTVLIRISGYEDNIEVFRKISDFKDVDVNSWSAPYFALAKLYGIVKGNPDGTVQPQQKVPTNRLVAFLLRVLDFKDVEWSKVMVVAKEKGLLDRVAVTPEQTLKRGQVAKIIYSALECKGADQKVFGEKMGYFQKSTSPTSPATSNPILSASDISKLVSPAVVYIETESGSGSGFIVESTGKFITNYHVIDKCKTAFIQLTNGSKYNVTQVIDYDKTRDIAILKVEASGLPIVKLGNSDSIENGDTIYTIGSPKGLQNSISDGLISNKDRILDNQKYIQISAPISPGSSGGALVNNKAEVIGITSAGYNNAQNINLAIPINAYKTMTRNLGITMVELHQKEYPVSKVPAIFEKCVDEVEDNDEFVTANSINNGDTVQGSYYNYNDIDTYKIDLTQSGNMVCIFGLTSDTLRLGKHLRIILFDGNQTAIAASTYSLEYDNVTLIKYLTAGTYYFQIFQGSDYKYLWNSKPYIFYAGCH